MITDGNITTERGDTWPLISPGDQYLKTIAPAGSGVCITQSLAKKESRKRRLFWRLYLHLQADNAGKE
jgi:hypothetical protein